MKAHDTGEIEVEDLQPPMRSMRVAMVTETWPPEVNGVAATISRIAEGLRRQGHALQLVRPRQPSGDETAPAGASGIGVQADPRFAEFLMRGLPIPRYPQLRMGLPSRRALVSLWSRQRPDVVHLVTEGPLGWSALNAALQLKLPVVSDFRTNFQAYSSHYGLAWLRSPIMGYLRRFHNRTACTMVPTQALACELAAAGFQGLRVIARGVDARQFDPARRDPALRQRWGVTPDQPVALCVGRLAPEKNLETVVDAWRAMRQVHAGSRLVLVGDGPERERLREACPEAIFAGVQRGEALAAHYASADVFLFASMTETFGNVVLEAMASGLAVLAYEHAAAGQIIRHGQDGLVAPLGDRATFLRLAARLARSPGERDAMRAEARNTACALDWLRIVQGIEGEYRSAIERHATRLSPAASALLQAG
jgi:glycosyltransferase involved in cell wall biosynthesis